MKKALFITIIASALVQLQSLACTNLLVGKDATTDGSTIITYSMDMYGYCGKLRIVPAMEHRKGEMCSVINYETDEILGEIPQVRHTHGVAGYINDCQVSITETTFGGREGLADPKGLMHYSALIQLALERSSNAREAIRVIADLCDKYGYASTGESLSIADPDEVWLMEIVGKGEVKGAVWVAVRIPDDCISAHANQSRIHRFDRNDRQNVMYHKDVVSFARSKGWFCGKDDEFDFCKAYSPADFGKQRICEARVWSIFNMFSDDFSAYIPSVDGLHLEEADSMPLYIKPNRKLSLEDAMAVMRDHFEGTPFDMGGDIVGGPWNSPYVPSPLSYRVNGMTYTNERPIATQQSACVEIYQMRRSLPDPVGGVLWFGNDDGAMVAYTPIYCGATRIPGCYNDPEASDVRFSENSAFWICNWVSNMIYPRYSLMYPILKAVRDPFQAKLLADQASVEARALAMPGDEAAEFLTRYGEDCAGMMMDKWKELGIHLIVMYNDMVIKPEKDGEFLTTANGHAVSPIRPGYNEAYRKAIVDESGDRYYKGEMTFVHITDTQIGFSDKSENYRMTDSMMTSAINAINRIRPSLVILTGDLVNKAGNEEQKAIYKRCIGELRDDIPLYVVPGNHDIRKFNTDNYNRYMEFVGYDRFSFKKGDCAFIGFDTNRIKADSDTARVAEEEQFAWLEKELAGASDCRHIYLFCHCPVAMASLDEPDGHDSFPSSKRQRYMDLFRKYGVEGIFSGHSHLGGYFESDGIRHVNSMAVAPSFGKFPSGINVVRVTPSGFTYEFRKGEN